MLWDCLPSYYEYAGVSEIHAYACVISEEERARKIA